GDDLPPLAVPLLERHAAVAFMIVPGHVDRVEEILGAERFDPRRIELEMFETPADFIAGERAMTELLLRDADRLDIEDAVDDAEVVIDAADALLVVEVALAGAVDCLHDFLQDRILRSGRLRGDGDIAFGGVAGRDDVLFRIRPDIADDVIGREAGLLR